jgi:hypothetical protein
LRGREAAAARQKMAPKLSQTLPPGAEHSQPAKRKRKTRKRKRKRKRKIKKKRE